MPGLAEARVVRDFEHALDSLAQALEATPTPIEERARLSQVTSSAGTLGPTAWICLETIESTLRLFPAPISPDRGVVLASRWVSPPRRLSEPIVEVFQVQSAVVVHSMPLTVLDPLNEIVAHEVVNLHPQEGMPTPTYFAASLLPDQDMHISIDKPTASQGDVGVLAARELRTLSSLSANDLGDLFPVVRETYQRWISGDLDPSQPNLRRLLALRRLFEAVQDRVGDVRVWLLTPIRDHEPKTPYDWLRQGRLTAVWNYLQETAKPVSYRLTRRGPGDYAIETAGSTRAADARMEPEDVDDASDWPDDEQ